MISASMVTSVELLAFRSWPRDVHLALPRDGVVCANKQRLRFQTAGRRGSILPVVSWIFPVRLRLHRKLPASSLEPLIVELFTASCEVPEHRRGSDDPCPVRTLACVGTPYAGRRCRNVGGNSAALACARACAPAPLMGFVRILSEHTHFDHHGLVDTRPRNFPVAPVPGGHFSHEIEAQDYSRSRITLGSLSRTGRATLAASGSTGRFALSIG